MSTVCQESSSLISGSRPTIVLQIRTLSWGVLLGPWGYQIVKRAGSKNYVFVVGWAAKSPKMAFFGISQIEKSTFWPLFWEFYGQKWGKMFIFMFKTTQEHLWDVYRLYLGIFGIFEFFDPLGGHFWTKIGHFWPSRVKNDRFWPKNGPKWGG